MPRDGVGEGADGCGGLVRDAGVGGKVFVVETAEEGGVEGVGVWVLLFVRRSGPVVAAVAEPQ